MILFKRMLQRSPKILDCHLYHRGTILMLGSVSSPRIT